MIIDKEKLIFVHIPKNAGTAIKSIFTEENELEKQFKHNTIHKIKKENLKIYNSYKKFAIVRNPYDRIVSFYAYYKRYRLDNSLIHTWGYNTNSQSYERVSTEKAGINDFRKWFKGGKKNLKDTDINESIKYAVNTLNPFSEFVKEHVFNPQHTWVDETVTILKFENLNEELNNFLGRKTKLPVVNATSKYDLLDYYDEEILNIVYEKYKEDFEKFNYKKL